MFDFANLPPMVLKYSAMNHLQYSPLLDILYIGDGGNDVSMIQAANVGVGIVGKVRATLIVFASFG